MVAAGVPILENRPDCIHFGAAGHVLGTAPSLQDEFTAYVPSRPQLEWQIRRRVIDIDNVDIVRVAVIEPRYDSARQQVTGVLLESMATRCGTGRSRCRRRRSRYPAAGLVGAVGI